MQGNFVGVMELTWLEDKPFEDFLFLIMIISAINFVVTPCSIVEGSQKVYPLPGIAAILQNRSATIHLDK